jgi:heme-degrading monooxygenase HmoA
MIVRHWRGLARADAASVYLDHLRTETLPRLRAIDGHCGAYVLQRDVGDEIEFVVLTFWDALESVRAFAGDDIEAAVVPPEVRRFLTSFDERVVHYELAIDPDDLEETNHDSANAEPHSATDKRLGRARQLARERTHILECHHASRSPHDRELCAPKPPNRRSGREPRISG